MIKPQIFFLGFVCNCLSYFTTAKITFTSIFPHDTLVGLFIYTIISMLSCNIVTFRLWPVHLAQYVGYISCPHIVGWHLSLRTWRSQYSNRQLLYRTFMHKLRDTLQSVGVKAVAYHSFRRGGASFAFQSGVPRELMVLGDWHSNAVFLYLTIPLNIRLQSVNLLCKAVLSSNHPPTSTSTT